MKKYFQFLQENRTYTILIGLVLLTAFLTVGGLALFAKKTVEVVISNGESYSLESRAWNVAGLLKENEIPLYQEDLIHPELNTRLKKDMTIRIIRGTQYVVVHNNEVITVVTTDLHPALVLEKAGAEFDNQRQHLYLDGEFWQFDQEISYAASHTLELRDLHRVTIDIEGEEIEIETDKPTVGEALWQADIQLTLNDSVSPPIETLIDDDLTVKIILATPIEIKMGDSVTEARVQAETVGAALLEAGMPLQGMDYSIPDEFELLPEDGKIRVVQVEEKVLVEQETIAFSEIQQALPDVDLDSGAQTVQSGEFGITAKRIRIRMEDGKEVGRVTEAEWTAKEPQPRIIGYGSKVTVKTLSTPDGTIEYYRAMTFYATSYSASRAGVSPDAKNYGITACGAPLETGLVGVDLDYIPCGTPLYIPGYGFAVASDTGNINGAWIDLGYSEEDWVNWHQNVTVYFLTPVPANVPLYIQPGTFW